MLSKRVKLIVPFVLVLSLFLACWYFVLREKPLSVQNITKEGDSSLCPENIIDERDGENYSVVQMGMQCWMAENLRTELYSNGSKIARVENDEEWSKTEEGGYSIYPNTGEAVFVQVKGSELGCGEVNDEAFEDIEMLEVLSEEEMVRHLGHWYNFYAINNPLGICPMGWHVPSHEDWVLLERSLCSKTNCGEIFPFELQPNSVRGEDREALKFVRADQFCNWDLDFNIEESSLPISSGFNALPGGFRQAEGPFSRQRKSAVFWSSTYDDDGIWVRGVDTQSDGMLIEKIPNWRTGIPVRCVKSDEF